AVLFITPPESPKEEPHIHDNRKVKSSPAFLNDELEEHTPESPSPVISEDIPNEPSPESPFPVISQGTPKELAPRSPSPTALKDIFKEPTPRSPSPVISEASVKEPSPRISQPRTILKSVLKEPTPRSRSPVIPEAIEENNPNASPPPPVKSEEPVPEVLQASVKSKKVILPAEEGENKPEDTAAPDGDQRRSELEAPIPNKGGQNHHKLDHVKLKG
ncbi:unnamed protein product, partial [Notodromas monacha]